MRLGLLKDLDWKLMGALLARESDTEQIDFFRSFIKECNSWGTKLQVEQQLACVNLKLTKEERQTLVMLSYEDEK